MPKYQIQSRVNNLTVTTELEADSKDAVIAFHDAVSVADILQVRRYVYHNPVKRSNIEREKGRYATVNIIFEYGLPTTIKIPDLKVSVSEVEIVSTIKSIYRHIKEVRVTIRR